MDVPQFEQAILRLAFETDARITTASVAYYLGLPSRRCNELLNALLAEGVLELDSDSEGNLYYRVPHKPQGGDELLGKLRRERQNPFIASNLLLTGPTTPSNSNDANDSNDSNWAQNPVPPNGRPIPSSIRLVSARDDDDSAPNSPRRLPGQEPGRGQEPDSGPWGNSGDSSDSGGSGNSGVQLDSQESDDWTYGDSSRNTADGWNEAQRRPRPRVRRNNEIFSGIVQHQARPDASINRCGASPVLVADSVRCDPRPLPTRKPVLASCVETKRAEPHRAETILRTQPDQWPVTVNSARSSASVERAQSRSNMMAPSAGGDLALRDDLLTQPEHQPGMALLLSLILCGTGQIYNGEVSKGIMMMVLCFLLWFVLLGWVVHIWSIVDSVVVAERLNRSSG
jgi:hypothetical protein